LVLIVFSFIESIFFNFFIGKQNDYFCVHEAKLPTRKLKSRRKYFGLNMSFLHVHAQMTKGRGAEESQGRTISLTGQEFVLECLAPAVLE